VATDAPPPASCSHRYAKWVIPEHITDSALRLRTDSVTAAVVQRLRDREVPSLVLKGPAIAYWLYDDAARPYTDSDLLIDPRDLTVAEQVLTQLGFRCEDDDRAHPFIFEAHAQEWRRSEDGAVVDLHWRLPGTESSPEVAWQLLAASAEPLSVGGTEVEVLGTPARAMHVAIHAAQHGRSEAKPMADLDRALDRLSMEVWQSAALLAKDLRAMSAFASGLRLSPPGRVHADRLGLPENPSRGWAPGTEHLPAPVLAFAGVSVAAARGARSIARSLSPPAAYMKAHFPIARRSRRGLAAAYAIRALRAIVRAPGAWQAFRRTQASTRPLGG
jgi:hypothetical protein